jgi:hypothetical protein
LQAAPCVCECPPAESCEKGNALNSCGYVAIAFVKNHGQIATAVSLWGPIMLCGSIGMSLQMLDMARELLSERLAKEPTLLLMILGIPNVGKSALVNSLFHLSHSSTSEQEPLKKAKVGPLPGVTQDLSGFKIGVQPSVYVLDTPGILVPNINNVETGLKLALTGAVKDSVVGEERVARYLLTVLNARSAHLRWKSEVHFSGISDSQSLIRSLLFIIAHVTRESLAQIIWSPEHFFQCLKHEWSKKHHGILL